jgi:hypothetical protein
MRSNRERTPTRLLELKTFSIALFETRPHTHQLYSMVFTKKTSTSPSKASPAKAKKSTAAAKKVVATKKAVVAKKVAAKKAPAKKVSLDYVILKFRRMSRKLQ